MISRENEILFLREREREREREKEKQTKEKQKKAQTFAFDRAFVTAENFNGGVMNNFKGDLALSGAREKTHEGVPGNVFHADAIHRQDLVTHLQLATRKERGK